MAIRRMWSNILLQALLLFHVTQERPAVKDVIDFGKVKRRSETPPVTVSEKRDLFVGKNATLQTDAGVMRATTVKNPVTASENAFGYGVRSQAREKRQSSLNHGNISLKASKRSTSASVKHHVAKRSNATHPTKAPAPENNIYYTAYKCTNTTLKHGEYTISEDGFLHIEKMRMVLHPSFYTKRKRDVMACIPTESDKKAEILFEALSIAAYTMLYTFMSLTFLIYFHIMIPVLIMWFFTSTLVSMYFSFTSFPGPDFLYGWVFRSIAYIQVAFPQAALMSLLTCNPVLACLERNNFFTIANNTVTVNIISTFLLFLFILLLLPAINFFAYLMPFTPHFTLETGTEAATKLLYYSPAHLFLVIVSMIVEALSRIYKKNVPDLGVNLTKYHNIFFKLHIYLFISEIFGLGSVICWLPVLIWLFSVTSYFVPTFLVFRADDY